jgi:FAD/FMN-containing dehydrogenase
VCVATRVEHVQAAVAYARANGLRIAAQTTGHLSQTLPSLRRTLLLKLNLHDGDVAVDPVRRVARIKAGARWADVVDAVAPHGLAAMHGSSPSVGVIGYLLGGGLSFYGRRHGLAVNHVKAFEVVTPDGLVRRVDAGHNRELFYALRGGGGGHAIVTAVELSLLAYSHVTAGAMFFPAADAMRLLLAWRDFCHGTPDSITTTFRVLRLPPLPKVPEPLRAVPTVCVDELRHLGGALATAPAGAGARGHLEGRSLLFGVGIPGAPAPAAELEAHLDSYLGALAPWATGTRFRSFAERTSSLKTCVPDPALARLACIRESIDPDRLLIASHLPPTGEPSRRDSILR